MSLAFPLFAAFLHSREDFSPRISRTARIRYAGFPIREIREIRGFSAVASFPRATIQARPPPHPKIVSRRCFNLASLPCFGKPD
jgi:hypothetical protein